MAARTAARIIWSLFAAALISIALAVAGVTTGSPASGEPPAPAPAAAPEFTVRRILDIPGPLKMGAWHWDEAGAPADGPVVITVDLEAQVLSVFRGGYEIGAAAILYGRDDKPTPLGAYPISEKDADHVSNLYDAPMPYMLRMTDDGISIHGSDSVAPGYATHGCIAIPVKFAKLVFDSVKLGDVVIVTRGKTLGLGEAIVSR